MAWDLIIIGAGAAGLVAAWHARRQGASVLVLNKGLVGRSGATITSGGGVSVAGETLLRLGQQADAGDTEARFLEDTVVAGSYLNDQRLVDHMVRGIGDELRLLFDGGIRFSVNRPIPGHSSGRGIRITGVDMQRTLTKRAQQAGARFREDFQSIQLLLRQGQVVGVLGLDRRSGEIEALYARAVVIATGGSTSNWNLRTAPEELSGEGQAMALAAGAELIDMEMTQFLPCCLTAPAIWRGLQFPWILGPQSGVHAWLLNRFGERFMARWDPRRMELATRDIVSAACAMEVHEGRGSPNGGVYLSWRHLPNDIVDNFPSWSRSFSADWQWEGFDMRPLVERIRQGYAIEVAPAAHFSLGGIRVDTQGVTGVAGLYACGEATGAVHGANRLSGNAGTQVLVQGGSTGRAAAAWALASTASPEGQADNLDEASAQARAAFTRSQGTPPFEVKEALAQLAESYLGPVRAAAGLQQGLSRLEQLRAEPLACRTDERVWNRDWSDALECQAAFPVLEAALRSALARTHSIGAHQRHDVGRQALGPLQHQVARLEAGQLQVRSEAVAMPWLQPAVADVAGAQAC